jgi:hypothetical protein
MSGAIVSGIALAVLGTLIFLGTRLTEGHWVYTLDDAYIHLAMARNLVAHGVWGVSSETFTSCSSSPFWTLLLAFFFRIIGARDWLPGILNVICTLLSLLVIDRTLTDYGVRGRLRILAGVSIFILVPFTVIASTGMEHSLHVLLTLAFVRVALAEFRDARSDRWTRAAVLGGLAFLMTSTRFESLFVVGPLAVVLFLKGRWRLGTAISLLALLPVMAHGIYAVAHGGFFLPNSLVLKGRFPLGGIAGFVFQLLSFYVRVSLENVHVDILCLLLLATACCRRIPEGIRLLAITVAAAGVAHLTFCECGRFYRYEAYLMASGFLLLAVAWLPLLQEPEILSRTSPFRGQEGWLFSARLGLVLFLAVPLFLRGVWATSRVVRASANIYQQQWQLARICSTLDLAGNSIAINDLGLMAYRSGVRLVDLWGLGTTEVARLKAARRYDRQAIAELLIRQRVDYVIVFDQWFAKGRELPDDLILVARLRNSKNIVCLQDTVMLYATSLAAAEKMCEHLTHLPFALPKETTVEPVFLR